MLGQLLHEVLPMFFMKVHFPLWLFVALWTGGNPVSPLTGGCPSFNPCGSYGSVSFSAAFSLSRFVSATHEFFCKSCLWKTVVNCHENLEGFWITTVRAVEERGVKLQFACWDGNYPFFAEIRWPDKVWLFCSCTLNCVPVAYIW